MGKDKNQADASSLPFQTVLIALGTLVAYRAFEKFMGIVRLHPVLSGLVALSGLASFVFYLYALWSNRAARNAVDEEPVAPATGAVFLGRDQDTGKALYLHESSRSMHTQVIGTTNAGKTASVVLPWAVSDIQSGRGFLMVDGKSDLSLLKNLYGYACRAGRQDDFLVFSLVRPEISATFNPLFESPQGSSELLSERLFSALSFTDEYYKNVQYTALGTLMDGILSLGVVPTCATIRSLLRSPDGLSQWGDTLSPDRNLEIKTLCKGDADKFLQKYSGLVTQLGHFSLGGVAPLFNTERPEIVLSECLKQNKLVYFQLPTLQYPFLGSATGKLVLQCLASSISELQTGGERLPRLFSVYLDDFNDYIYPGFVSLLNKSRSANVGVVFSHQSIGDLEKVGADFKQTVLVNTNVKIILRSNDPATAEHFAKQIGTLSTEKTTERRTRGVIGAQDTGEQSVRGVEEYVIHPNVFKRELGLGQGVAIIPHSRGQIVRRVRFTPTPDFQGGVTIPEKRRAGSIHAHVSICAKASAPSGQLKISGERGITTHAA